MSPWGMARRRRLDSEQPGRRVRRRIVRPAARAAQLSLPKFPYHFGDQPMKKYAKLKYVVHTNGAGSGVNAAVSYQYRANGMFDPEVAMGGHQPYGFDQLMAQYEHYTVLKSTIELEIVDLTDDSTQNFMLSVHQALGAPAAAFAAGGSNGLNEMPIVSKVLIPNTGIVQTRHRNAKLSANMPKIFGVTAQAMIGDSRFQGDFGADPTEDCYYGVTYYTPTGTAEAKSNMFKVTIIYYAVFTEPKWFTTS